MTILIQIFFALLVGGTAARALSGVIRTLVVRTMPVEQRISDESFDIQTRTSTIIGIAIALVVAGGIYWGIEWIKAAVGTPEPVVTEQSLITSLNDLILPPEEEEENTSSTPAPSVTLPDPNEQPPAAIPSPAPASAIDDAPIESGWGDYHLQLGAYREGNNAYHHARRLREYFPRLVNTLMIHDGPTPNKVLIGPFPTRRAAVRYRKRHRLSGFVRRLE